MDRSRIIALVGAGIGIFATFIPWASAGPFSVSGIDGPDGLINLGIFGVPLALNLIGDREAPTSKGYFIATMVFGVLGVLFGILKLATVSDAGRLVSPGMGLFLILLAGIVILAHRAGQATRHLTSPRDNP